MSIRYFFQSNTDVDIVRENWRISKELKEETTDKCPTEMILKIRLLPMIISMTRLILISDMDMFVIYCDKKNQWFKKVKSKMRILLIEKVPSILY